MVLKIHTCILENSQSIGSNYWRCVLFSCFKMDYLGDNAGLGLTGDQTEKVLQFQDLTGIEDMTVCRDVLQRHQWNLEVAVQEQLNIR